MPRATMRGSRREGRGEGKAAECEASPATHRAVPAAAAIITRAGLAEGVPLLRSPSHRIRMEAMSGHPRVKSLNRSLDLLGEEVKR